ncbi:MAG: hypothetical protein AB7N65_31075 [Vicinamibacterales bacterium]
MVLSYGDRATRGDVAARHRSAHLDEMVDRCRLLFDQVDVMQCEPYSIRDISDLVSDLIREVERPIIDVTCLTKVHTIGVARACAGAGRRKWRIAYTLPSNYGASDIQGPWRDTLLVPIGEHPELRRPGHARGIMLLGNEPTRVMMTMSELEPSAGVVVVTSNTLRPDFGGRASDMNADLLAYLAQSSMPDAGLSSGFRVNDSWRLEGVDLRALDALDVVVGAEIARARVDGAPIVLFPYGPKPVIFGAAYRLAIDYGKASWALYTVRDSHSLSYCEGFEETVWIGHRG